MQESIRFFIGLAAASIGASSAVVRLVRRRASRRRIDALEKRTEALEVVSEDVADEQKRLAESVDFTNELLRSRAKSRERPNGG